MNGKDFAQEAADRLNDASERYGHIRFWRASDYGNYPALTAYADLLAELAEAKADLREIDRLASPEVATLGKVSDVRKFQAIAAIAAKHRVETDPLVDAIQSVLSGFETRQHAEDYANKIRAELDKRGLAVGVKS